MEPSAGDTGQEGEWEILGVVRGLMVSMWVLGMGMLKRLGKLIGLGINDC